MPADSLNQGPGTSGSVSISGPVTANQGTAASDSGAWPVAITDKVNGEVTVTAAHALKTDSSATTQPVSASSLPLPTGAATSSNQTNGTQITQVSSLPSLPTGTNSIGTVGLNAGANTIGSISNTSFTATQATGTNLHTTVDNFPATQPVSGTVTVQQATASNLNATVSGTVTANIGTTNGLALDSSVNAISLSQGSTTSGEKGILHMGAVTTAAPTYTTAQTSPISLTTSGATRVDGSGVTQPVSGTITANAGSGNFTVAQATAANLNATVTGTVTSNQGTANTVGNAWPVKITDGTNTAAVKAASTAAVATDPAEVVALSPNSPLPTGSNTIGALTANQSVNLAQVTGNATATSASGVQKVGIVGNANVNLDIAQNTAAAANSVAVGGTYNTTIPALTAGNQSMVQLDSTGAMCVNIEGRKQTFACGIVALTPIASTTSPFISLTGSATKTVRILSCTASFSATTGTAADLIARRFSALSGGTSTSQAANVGKMDSTNAAATAVPNSWSVAATTATSAGIMAATRVEIDTAAGSTIPEVVVYNFVSNPGQSLVLRGTSEFFGICISAVGTTPIADCWITWTEE